MPNINYGKHTCCGTQPEISFLPQRIHQHPSIINNGHNLEIATKKMGQEVGIQTIFTPSGLKAGLHQLLLQNL